MMLQQGSVWMLVFMFLGIEIAGQPEASNVCCGNQTFFAAIPPVTVNYTSDTGLKMNEDWQPFYFGPAGSWALASNTSGAFYSNYTVPIVVRITDSFQTGDQFALYLNGTLMGNTTVSAANSSSYTIYPSEAWVDPQYSHGEWLIPPGMHRFTIKVLESVEPLGSGAFIRADINPAIDCGSCRPNCSSKGPCKCYPVADGNNPAGCCPNSPVKSFPTCREASGQFYLIKGSFTRDQGIQACTRMNLRLAEVTAANFDGINQFAYVCNGNETAKSWIRSWNGDDYQNDCLVLSSGSFGGTGAINAQPCDSKNYVLCQE